MLILVQNSKRIMILLLGYAMQGKRQETVVVRFVDPKGGVETTLTETVLARITSSLNSSPPCLSSAAYYSRWRTTSTHHSTRRPSKQ